MTIFKLEQFPFVCRLCLQTDLSQQMFHMNCWWDEVFEGSIGDFFASITFPISEEKSHLFPQMICRECLDMAKFFAKYRTKVMNVHRLMNCLVELKNSNTVPIEDLFRNKREPLQTLFRDLGLCSKSNPEAADLINEFSQYKLASIGAPIKEEPQEVINLKEMFAEECSPEELVQLTDPPPAKKQKKQNETPKPPRKKKELNMDFLKDDESLILDASQFETYEEVAAIKMQYGGPKSDVLLQCNKCEYNTYTYANFKSHQLVHLKRELKKHSCQAPGCSEVFDTLLELQRHRASQHKKKAPPIICEDCGHPSATADCHAVHKQRHLKLGSHICQYCQRKFHVQMDLWSHIRTAHMAIYKYECKTCGKKFKRGDACRMHELSHGDVYAFPCSLCEAKFKRPYVLSRHMKRVHAPASKICEHCSAKFFYRYDLLNHIEVAHGIQMRFLCETCDQPFSSEQDLKIHSMRHTNPKELECPTCLTVFLTQAAQDEHPCFTYRDDYICCGRDQRCHQRYNDHMFEKHGIETKVRVRRDPNVLLGVMRAGRKRVESCTKCEEIFPTRTLKKQHMETCAGKAVESIANQS